MPPKFQRAARTPAPATAREETPETNKLFGLSGTLPRLVEADVARITPNPDQPRTTFGEAALRSLADSIAKHGLQQPILVKTTGTAGAYQLVAGERRWRAHHLLGRATIPAIITEGRAEEIALIENVQRVDLDAVDLARSVQSLMDAHGYRMVDVGAMLGCAEAEVSRRLSVLRLPADVLDEYRRDPDQVSRSVLVELATLDDPDRIRALWRQALAGMTVRELRTAKRGGEVDRPQSDTLTPRAIDKSLTRAVGDLTRLHDARPALSDAQRANLRTLRDRIDALLGE
ncbi:ParB/RepB/Spo0J family partition protein [Azospirillum sp. RWY-5-1]|uniref:ParB/RepB/Spo0J family partition protein n=1 Tax=Azospirillum oleiclasticum TaxID=2735135 RepID=A0ABX2TL59_9PROT|nr:ParB/RepB/Spo0J family partition protein [Azospirillum oleiclasticum]NYZ17887.1 ParB/RepB/Spo0J family partition protein [Azospirillum oleiclasticum]NYZ25095.1 ParB/RepB/Spo0J family partition protein [Azospirillum oleiclasticum]